MCHVETFSKRQLQHLISLCNRFIYYVHSEFAGVVSNLFKFIFLELNAEWCILHFKCSYDFAVPDKLMDSSVETMFVAFRIGCFKLIAAMLFAFEFQYFRSHPLLNNFGFFVC